MYLFFSLKKIVHKNYTMESVNLLLENTVVAYQDEALILYISAIDRISFL